MLYFRKGSWCLSREPARFECEAAGILVQSDRCTRLRDSGRSRTVIISGQISGSAQISAPFPRPRPAQRLQDCGSAATGCQKMAQIQLHEYIYTKEGKLNRIIQ